jgi:hypothetical protein
VEENLSSANNQKLIPIPLANEEGYNFGDEMRDCTTKLAVITLLWTTIIINIIIISLLEKECLSYCF